MTKFGTKLGLTYFTGMSIYGFYSGMQLIEDDWEY